MAEEVRAEMVANVMAVSVTDGGVVSDVGSMVVSESMKKEIPVLTEVDGTASELAVHRDDVVQEGDLLAIVE